MKITIIGAGVAGSVLCDILTEIGHEVTVIEKFKSPGGMCKSYYKDGFTYEYGPHILATHHSTKLAKNYILFLCGFLSHRTCSPTGCVLLVVLVGL